MIKKLTIGFIILIVIVLLTIGIPWFLDHKDQILSKPNYKPYTDSIALLQRDNDKLHLQNDSLTNAIDTVIINKEKVQIQYKTIYKYINGYTIDQLDSVIKANIKE